MGEVAVSFTPEELGFEIEIGTIDITECEMINQFKGSSDVPPQFTRGYGLRLRPVRAQGHGHGAGRPRTAGCELGEEQTAPAQDEEFVLSHADNVQATGFVEHLKLPHYVDFQAELELLRRLRQARPHGASQEAAE